MLSAATGALQMRSLKAARQFAVVSSRLMVAGFKQLWFKIADPSVRTTMCLGEPRQFFLFWIALVTWKTVCGTSRCIALCPQLASGHTENPVHVHPLWSGPTTHNHMRDALESCHTDCGIAGGQLLYGTALFRGVGWNVDVLCKCSVTNNLKPFNRLYCR